MTVCETEREKQHKAECRVYDGWEKRHRLQFLSHGQLPFTRVGDNLGGHFLLLTFETIMVMWICLLLGVNVTLFSIVQSLQIV